MNNIARALRPKPRKPKRKRVPYSGALYDPGQQLSGGDLAKAARDLTSLEFGPQKKALQRQLDTTTTQGTALADKTAGYYQDLANREAGNVGQEAAIGQLLASTLSKNAATASTATTQAQTDADARAAADAQVRGVIGQPGVRTAEETQAAQDRIAAEGQRATDAAASSTASYQQLADLAGRARAQAGGEAHTELLNRLATAQTGIRQQLADLGAQEGASRSKNLTDLRQQAYENLVTQRGLNIKQQDLDASTKLGQQKLAEDRRQAQADRRLKRRIARNARVATQAANAAKTGAKLDEVNKYGVSNRDWLKMSRSARLKAVRDFTKASSRTKTAATGGAGQPTVQAQKMVSQVESGLADAQTDPKLRKYVKVAGPRLTKILTNRGLPPLLAQAAAELAKHKYVTPGTRAALERSGIVVPRAWIAPYNRPGALGPPVP